MKDRKKGWTGRFSAALLGTVLLCVVLLSSAFLAAEVQHDCAGHDCAVCAQMNQCAKTLRVSSGGILLAAAVYLVAVTAPEETPLRLLSLVYRTPVSQKIRLND